MEERKSINEELNLFPANVKPSNLWAQFQQVGCNARSVGVRYEYDLLIRAFPQIRRIRTARLASMLLLLFIDHVPAMT